MKPYCQVRFCVLALAQLVFFTTVQAMLGPGPSPFMVVSADQQNCLVMCPIPKSNEDEGRTVTLPDGRKLDMFTAFPSNGVYRLPSLAPAYFLGFYAETNELFLSRDFTKLAVVDEWALAGSFGRQMIPPRPGLKFYDQGILLRTLEVRELVDQLSMFTIPWAGGGLIYPKWFDSWGQQPGNRIEVVTAERGLFVYGHELVVSRGNRLVFDFQTGALLSEDRPFARVRRRAALGLLAVVGLGLAVFFFKRSRAAAK
jgi:hypothetical protein